MRKHEDPVQAAIEEAGRRPLPPLEERARLQALAAEALADPRPQLTTDEIMTRIEAMRPHAAE
jgi:hypothetical protein